MTITKWTAFMAGLPIAATEIWKTLIEVANILTAFAMLGALWAAGSGLFWGYWLTASPHGIPMWWVWMTRASAVAWIAFIPSLVVRAIMRAGRKQLEAGCASAPGDSRSRTGCL